MKTIDVLNLDCSIPKNRLLLNKFLYKIDEVKEICFSKDMEDRPAVTLNVLENIFNQYCLKYSYYTQGIKQYYEGEKFIYHYVSIVCRENTVDWVGNVYGKSIWELFAKMVIMIYADIIKKGKKKEV